MAQKLFKISYTVVKHKSLSAILGPRSWFVFTDLVPGSSTQNK